LITQVVTLTEKVIPHTFGRMAKGVNTI